jgi:hypothetical protein
MKMVDVERESAQIDAKTNGESSQWLFEPSPTAADVLTRRGVGFQQGMAFGDAFYEIGNRDCIGGEFRCPCQARNQELPSNIPAYFDARFDQTGAPCLRLLLVAWVLQLRGLSPLLPSVRAYD